MTKEKTLGVNAFTGSRKSSGAEASEGEVGHEVWEKWSGRNVQG